jgi:hypothetical protein
MSGKNSPDPSRSVPPRRALDLVKDSTASLALEDWKNIPDRGESLKEIDAVYQGYLLEFTNSSNLCVEGYQRLSRAHFQWRKTMILGTGAVALLNLLSAYKWDWKELQHPLSLAAALVAVTLSVLANLESSANCIDQAQAYREARELFLDSAREFERLWIVHVLPLGDSPEACFNADALYRRVVAKDAEIRTKLKELTKIEFKRKK